LIAGFVSAAMMHVVLMLLYSPAWYGRYILAGLAFAVAPGLVTGLVCGVVWCAALYREGKRAVAEGVLQREQAGATSNGQQG